MARRGPSVADFAADFGIYLKSLRFKTGWLMAECSRRTKIQTARWSDLERGQNRQRGCEPSLPSPVTCRRIAAAFNVPEDIVLARAGYMPRFATPLPDEIEWLALYRRQPTLLRKRMLALLRLFCVNDPKIKAASTKKDLEIASFGLDEDSV